MDATAQEQQEREARYRQRMVETVKLDPTVPFILGGREHVMVFNNRAVKDILKDVGINLLTTSITSEEMLKPDVLSVVILRGLQSKSPDLTLADVDEQLTTRHMLYYQTQLAKALQLFYPDMEDLPLPSGKTEDGEEDPTMQPIAHGSDTGQLVGQLV